MKVFIIILLFLLGLLGLAMSLCGGAGMVLFAKNGGLFIGGAFLVAGVGLLFAAIKGIGAMSKPDGDVLPPPAAPPPPDQPL